MASTASRAPPLRASPTDEEFDALQLLKGYRPGFFVSGHIHDLPYQPGNTWRTSIGETVVITPGQLLDVPIPNHVILHLPNGEGQWITSRGTE